MPIGLRRIVDAGLIMVDGCCLSRELASKSHAALVNFPDRTGYECFVNHVHVDDFAAGHWVPEAVRFVTALCARAKREYPDQSFRAIVSTDGLSCVARFHVLRPGECWGVDDLETYDECVLVMDL
ncbi:MAG: hypothetical protein K8R36_12540 [Planctomycetales bacterium]|nr:hypothetical protein [Planctomycetales bacterium]